MARFTVQTDFVAKDNVSGPVRRMQKRIAKFADKTNRSFSRLGASADQFGGSMRRMGVAAVAGGAAAAAAIAKVLESGVQLETKVAAAAARFDTSFNRLHPTFQAINTEIQEVAETSRFTANEVADAMNVFASTGQTAESSMTSLGFAAKFATATSMDMAEATTLLTDSMGAFGQATKDPLKFGPNMKRVGDLIVGTANASQTGVADMFEAFKQGAPVGISAGQTMETIAAMTGLFAQSGIKGTRAGTALKNIFTSIAAPGSAAAKIMRDIGVRTSDADGNMRNSVDVFRDFANAFKTLPKSEQLPIMEDIFGKIPLASALNAVENVDALRDLEEVLGKTEGSVGKVASLMEDTADHSMKILKSAITGVKVAIFGMNRDGIKETVEMVTRWVGANKELLAQKVGGFIRNIIDNLGFLVDMGVRILKTIGLLSALVLGIKAVAVAIILVTVAMDLNPFGAIITGIALAVSAVIALVIWWDKLMDGFDQLGPTMKIITSLLLGPLFLFKKLGELVMWVGGLIGWLVKKIVAVSDSFLGWIFPGLKATEPGEGDSDASPSGFSTSQVVGPEERLARTLEERKTTNELTIKDTTGRAELTGSLDSPIYMQSSVAFP